MHRTRAALIVFVALTVVCTGCTQENRDEQATPAGAMYESFEAELPAGWRATRPDSLSLSDAHYKHGTHSLRWDWRAGESIEIAHGVGDVSRTGGYGGYHKAAFGIWLYCPEPVEGTATVEFIADGDVGGSFEFPLGFQGWRRAALHYRHGNAFTGTVPADTDTIRLTAPRNVNSGTLFVDLVIYNGIIDYRLGCRPVDAFAWRPVDPDEVETPVARPDEVSEAELTAMERIAAAIDPPTEAGYSYSADYMAERAREFEAFGVTRTQAGVIGKPLVPNPGFYESAGVPDPPQTPAEMATWMREIAAAYHWTGNEAQRAQMAEWYAALSDHLHDQGFAAASGNRWGGYDGRRLADAMFWMRDVMRERGRGEREAAFFDYNWGVSRVLDASYELHVSLDQFGINEPRRLMGALLRPDPAERYQWVACFADVLSREILLQSGDGFKPDGSAYHHGAHYFAYASYNVPVLISTVEKLDDTPFEITPEATERLKLYLRNLQFYANLLDVPFSMHGRHPFRGGTVRPSMYLAMAHAGPGANDFDTDLAATYLRLLGEPPEEDPFPERNVTAASPPQGNLAMNYAGLSAHRRDDWLVTVHAYGRYFWGTEIYANVNAFGGYIGAGQVTVLGAGDPISLAGSGYVPEGWDWSRFDGTTVVYLPIDEVRNPRNGTQHTRTEHGFAGALSHRGQQGLLVHQTQGPEWLAPGLTAKKSYFLIDDRVICLGSNITADVENREVQTNLFQRHLSSPDTPVTIDGEQLTGLELERALPSDRAHWLIDTVGTGYLLPPGQDAIVSRQHQQSRDKDDREDTEGDFATAWINHGVAPTSASYEYAIVPGATPARLRSMAATLESGGRPWEVLRQDERAHIIRDRETGIIGCVLFEAGAVEPELPLASVDRPCLVMLEPEADGWWLTVCDPDLNLVDHLSEPRQLRVYLRGEWTLSDAPTEVRAAGMEDGQTLLEVTCHDGFSFTTRLAAP